MLIVTRPDLPAGTLDHLVERVEGTGLRTHVLPGPPRTLIACTGDPALLDAAARIEHVAIETVTRLDRPWTLPARACVPHGTRVPVGDAAGTVVGGPDLVVIAGPCAVEGREMLEKTALAVRDAGAHALRGGAFKPRSSPWAFQGLGGEALALLREVRARTGMSVVTEVLDPRQVELVAEHVDVLQIGARNMQNFPLLIEAARVHRPILLKRGLSATLSELLQAAEYILAQGNGQVMLCERGIRTYETATRNTLDVGGVAVLKRETHLPVLVDPSHAAGEAALVPALALAGIAAGADGLLVEVHPDPTRARSDGDQSMTLPAFATLMHQVRRVGEALDRPLAGGILPREQAA